MSISLRALLVTVTLIVFASRADTVDAENLPYSLVLRHGRVVDGTGNAWFYGDVGVKDDRIAFVGTLADAAYTAEKEIDVRGLVVAPGFIDVHTHADDDLYKL